MTTKDRIIEIISEFLEIPPGEITPALRFQEDLGANSLDIVNLILRVEQVFQLGETPESMLENLKTVGEVIELVDALRSDEPSEVLDVVDILVASDHAGLALKNHLFEWLRTKGHAAMDMGPEADDAVDYPEFARLVATRVANGEARFGILICGSGLGMSMAANKVAGVRAARVCEPVSAGLARRHNDANVLCLGERITGISLAEACVEAFLQTEFDPGNDGRHQRRVKLLEDCAT